MEKIIKTVKRWINKRKNSGTHFFIHIPKTAGTSFRKSLEDGYDVIPDYGANNEQTHPLVRKFVYDKNDIYDLQKSLAGEYCWLTGHVWLEKYQNIAAPQNIVTFVRNPIDRVISHFNHQLRWGETNTTIEEFVKEQKARNTQFRYLKALPIRLIGMVGITERYNHSLSIIKQQYNLKVDYKNENSNEQKKLQVEDLDAALEAEITESNQQDIALYKEAQEILEERLSWLSCNKPWTYMWANATEQSLQGIAFRAEVESPIPLRLIDSNKRLLKEFTASSLTPLFPNVQFPRNRYVGFKLRLTAKDLISDDLFLECSDTLQKLKIELRRRQEPEMK